jgi:hypothetical protein
MDVLERENEKPVDEKQVKGWLDEIYAGEVSERWKAEFDESSGIFQMACIGRLFPYQSDEDLGEQFYKMFDGTEVLPVSFEKEFLNLQETNFLEASELLVNLSWAQFKRLERAELVKKLSQGWPKVVDVPYDEEFGLRLDVKAASA